MALGCGPIDQSVESDVEASKRNVHPTFSEYEGTYVLSPLVQLEVEAVEGWIALDPPTWTGRPYLARLDGERFSLVAPYESESQVVEFFRDSTGAVSAVELTNFDPVHDGKRFTRAAPYATPSPAGLFRKGRPIEAARAALADPTIRPAQLHRFAIEQMMSLPTRRVDIAHFLKEVADGFPQEAGLLALYGYSLVAMDLRSEAHIVLDRAQKLDPNERNASEALRRLGLKIDDAAAGYRALLPFSLHEAYAEPTAEDIAAVGLCGACET